MAGQEHRGTLNRRLRAEFIVVPTWRPGGPLGRGLTAETSSGSWEEAPDFMADELAQILLHAHLGWSRARA